MRMPGVSLQHQLHTRNIARYTQCRAPCTDHPGPMPPLSLCLHLAAGALLACHTWANCLLTSGILEPGARAALRPDAMMFPRAPPADPASSSAPSRPNMPLLSVSSFSMFFCAASACALYCDRTAFASVTRCACHAAVRHLASARAVVNADRQLRVAYRAMSALGHRG
jgi:hypothetical protein